MKVLVLAALPLLLLAGCDPEKPDTGAQDEDMDGDGFFAADDCDDWDADRNPDESEIWYDGVDQDCDGNDDDQDGDGYAVDANDCDDLDAAVHPEATEVCDEVDNDCDGVADAGAEDAVAAWVDADMDGYGDPNQPTTVCGAIEAGFADNDGDCDDAHADAYPGAPEVCDDYDNDCDSEINEGQPDEVAYFLDADADGFGDAESWVLSCATPVGYTADAGDCDDTRPDIHPGVEENCDDTDWDCDGSPTAGATDATAYYDDADDDGHGDPSTRLDSCEAIAGMVTEGEDCDDTDAGAFPGNNETCDGVDNDCTGAADEGLTTTFHADADGDGFGDPAATGELCELEAGWSADATDCDDTDAQSHPGATELCDLEDNDCDSTVDEDATDARTYYVDADLDGYGEPSATTEACGAPTGYAYPDYDCDDTDAAVSPGATETCNTLDDDCDGDADEDDAADALTWYADDDGDAFGDPEDVRAACAQPAGFVADASDCDDARAANYPGADEHCADGQDNDCDGSADEADAVDALTFYADVDADGFGTASSTQLACTVPSGFAATADDCNDGDATISPSAVETCDDADNDCDSAVDEAGAAGEGTYFQDADLDGFGDASVSVTTCDAPTGYVTVSDDCDDADGTAFPGAAEADDLADDDCDGWVDEDYVVAGDLVISEITRQPRFGSSSTVAAGQWFEVYNTSARTIDLSDWYVVRTSSVGTDAWYVDPDEALQVAPGGHLVFCKTDDYTSAATSYSTLVCDYVWGDESQAATYSGTYHDNTFNLQRDEDTLQLYVGGDASSGALVDEVHWTYDATSGYWPRTAQYSMQLGSAALDGTSNDDEANWCLPATSRYWYRVSTSNIEYGTPGVANDPC